MSLPGVVFWAVLFKIHHKAPYLSRSSQSQKGAALCISASNKTTKSPL
jgi:hypothetical protein